ncbi:MAG: helix-turn-helix domain-containing protein [Chloroflexi bacterium]|nr:helix-turn-helix domain-containing protein [Chloroflexota bacterium]
MNDKLVLLTAKEAAEYLRISLFTLNKIQQEDKLIPFRTPGGHRRYSLDMLNEYLKHSQEGKYHQENVRSGRPNGKS